jgi:hypothetical protein
MLLWEVEEAVKEMRVKTSTGGDDVPGYVLKLMGEDGVRLRTQLINNMYENGEWPKDFTKVAIFAIKKKPKATKCSVNCTYSKHRSKDT